MGSQHRKFATYWKKPIPKIRDMIWQKIEKWQSLANVEEGSCLDGGYLSGIWRRQGVWPKENTSQYPTEYKPHSLGRPSRSDLVLLEVMICVLDTNTPIW
jgi:hypothetical protein